MSEFEKKRGRMDGWTIASLLLSTRLNLSTQKKRSHARTHALTSVVEGLAEVVLDDLHLGGLDLVHKHASHLGATLLACRQVEGELVEGRPQPAVHDELHPPTNPRQHPSTHRSANQPERRHKNQFIDEFTHAKQGGGGQCGMSVIDNSEYKAKWMNGWMDGYADGWMDGRMDK